MAKTKTTGFYFKMSPEESEWFERRMAETGISNKSAFIRKMCIDGHAIKLELTTLNEVKRLLGITANNSNQIAKRVNSGGEAYREDIAELNEQITEVRIIMGELLNVLSEAVNPKPGKRFTRPLTVRDLPEYNQAGEEA
jgi:hypothetical protein